MSREQAVKQAQRELEDAKNNGGSGTKLEQQNQIHLLKEKKEKFLNLKQAEGKVFCELSGFVGRIMAQAGTDGGHFGACGK